MICSAAMKTALVVVALAALGCGGAASAPASTTPSPPPSSNAAAADAPTARVLGVAVSDMEDKFTRITVSFENKTGKVCRIAKYVVRWNGGTKEFPLDDFSLGAGESKTRASRIHSGDGDITQLTDAASTHVDVNATCK
jgi:hypothetical protein